MAQMPFAVILSCARLHLSAANRHPLRELYPHRNDVPLQLGGALANDNASSIFRTRRPVGHAWLLFYAPPMWSGIGGIGFFLAKSARGKLMFRFPFCFRFNYAVPKSVMLIHIECFGEMPRRRIVAICQ